MFERFTETARRTLFFARYEASELSGTAIEPEHILLGLLRADDGLTPHGFVAAELSYADAKETIRPTLAGRHQIPVSQEIPFSAPARRVLECAVREADGFGHRHVDAGHLLLGVLGENGSFAARMLDTHGMKVDDLRRHVATPPVTVVPEQVPDDGPNGAVLAADEAAGALTQLENLRLLIQELGHGPPDVEVRRSLVDEIEHQLDALRRQLTRRWGGNSPRP